MPAAGRKSGPPGTSCKRTNALTLNSSVNNSCCQHIPVVKCQIAGKNAHTNAPNSNWENAVQTPAAFEYERATSVEHALSLLQSLGPEARIVAGGHSLLPMMKLRLARPDYLIDINDLKELDYIRQDGDEVLIGALTRHNAILASDLLAELFPIFRDAEKVIAD